MALEAFWQDVTIVLTLLLLEAVLSFDNAAILAAMVWRLPMKDRRKALLYGLVGAYILRTGAILLAAFLIDNPSFKLIGGGYLIFIAVKHFYQLARHREQSEEKTHVAKPGSFWASLGVPALVAIIIQIELVDLAFAIDQVVVAVAFTDKVLLIILASMIGILFLRIAAAYISRVMDWLPLLEHMAYIAVFYVGVKLILLHPWFSPGGECVVPALTHLEQYTNGASATMCEIPTPVSVTVTLGLFGIPILVKALLRWPASRVSHHTPLEAAAKLEPEQLGKIPPGPNK